jgi:hypothetical protein
MTELVRDKREANGSRQTEAVAEVVNKPSDGGGSDVSRVVREFGIWVLHIMYTGFRITLSTV